MTVNGISLRAKRVCPKPMKAIYATRKIALNGAATAKRAYGVVLRAYKCKGCHSWHLTSQPKRGKPCRNQ